MLTWPIREGVLAYLEVVKSEALEEFRLQKLAYMIAGGKRPPKPPAILKG